MLPHTLDRPHVRVPNLPGHIAVQPCPVRHTRIHCTNDNSTVLRLQLFLGGCVCEVHSLKACLVTLVTLVCARSQCSRAPHVFGGARGVRGAGLSP